MPPLDAARMAVPFCDLTAVNRELAPQLEGAYLRVMASGNLILGREVQSFEAEWAAYCQRRFCVGVGNGFDALKLAMMAFMIGEGCEVIVPAHTCIATWMAVSAVGATIVPVDIGEDYLINPELIRRAITGRTRAILAVHLYGRPCNMPALRSICDEIGLTLLVDAAQAHGLKGDDLGDCAAFSFYPTKNLGALGDGGAIVTNDSTIADYCMHIRNYGSRVKNRHEVLGENSRLDEMQAAFLRAKLPYLDRFNARRLQNAERYGLATDGVHHQVVFRTYERDDVRARLRLAGVETLVHYPTLPHQQLAYRWMPDMSFPVAERVAQEVVSLPCGPELNRDQVEYVAYEVGRA